MGRKKGFAIMTKPVISNVDLTNTSIMNSKFINSDIEEVNTSDSNPKNVDISEQTEETSINTEDSPIVKENTEETSINTEDSPIVKENTEETTIVKEKTEETPINTEESSLNTEESPIIKENTEDSPIVKENTEESPINTEETSINTEESTIVKENTEETPINTEENTDSSNLVISDNLDCNELLINNAEIMDSLVRNDTKLSNTDISDLDDIQITNSNISKSFICDSVLSNVVIDSVSFCVDYTQNILNGQYGKVVASETINKYQCVEATIINGKFQVRPTDPLSRNAFFGIAQNSASPGEIVSVLTRGTSILSVRQNVNLPVLTRVNGQCVPMRDNTGKVITQSVPIPINKTDLLVLACSGSDILSGPKTQYYQYNSADNNGFLTVYKSIQINPNNCSYNINYTDQNTVLLQKLINSSKFIQILDINSSTGEITGYLS